MLSGPGNTTIMRDKYMLDGYEHLTKSLKTLQTSPAPENKFSVTILLYFIFVLGKIIPILLAANGNKCV